MEQHFSCTICGQCCYGWLPLTINDALIHAIHFPLAFVWTIVPQGVKTFEITAKLGIKIKLPNHKKAAVLIAPTSYIPPYFPCPVLTADNLCSIHEIKPKRCKTMPFYPYRDENDQADMLRPRKNWKCNISLNAPVVYREQKIIDRVNFGYERNELLAQVPIIHTYAEYILKYTPGFIEQLMAIYPSGYIITSLSSFMTATRKKDKILARYQQKLFNEYAAKTAHNDQLTEYHQNYSGWAREMDYLSQH